MQMDPGWSHTLADGLFILGSAVITSIVSFVLFRRTSDEMKGMLVERVAGHTDDIKELKDTEQRQWQEIGHLGQRVSAVEVKAFGKANQ